MGKNYFMGLVVLLILVQLPLLSPLSREDCYDLPRSYHYECKQILKLDLSNQEKKIFIESLQVSNSISTTPTYPSLFSLNEASQVLEESNYDPKENFYSRFRDLSKLMIFVCINFFFYSAGKRYWGLR